MAPVAHCLRAVVRGLDVVADGPRRWHRGKSRRHRSKRTQRSSPARTSRPAVLGPEGHGAAGPRRQARLEVWISLASRPAAVSLVRSRMFAVMIATALGALYIRVLRKSILNWGATDEEASARLPGDELLEHADGVSTRAIDIDAPRAAVWPWLAQMGPSPRGGAYTYDWIENLLGVNMHSGDRVLPRLQHPEVGDTIGFGPNTMRLERVEPSRVLAWRSEDGNWVWTFV